MRKKSQNFKDIVPFFAILALAACSLSTACTKKKPTKLQALSVALVDKACSLKAQSTAAELSEFLGKPDKEIQEGNVSYLSWKSTAFTAAGTIEAGKLSSLYIFSADSPQSRSTPTKNVQKMSFELNKSTRQDVEKQLGRGVRVGVAFVPRAAGDNSGGCSDYYGWILGSTSEALVLKFRKNKLVPMP